MQIQSILSQKVVSNETVTTADARKLHSFIDSKRQFANWIDERIQKYGFVENVDYIKTSRKVGNATAYDYHITLDMAKELCMVENNEKGREARRYFIECEKHLNIGTAQYSELQSVILNQNTTIAALSKEIEQIKLNQPKRAGYMDAMFLNETLDLVGQAQYFCKESEMMIEALQRRKEGMERFISGVLKTHPNEKTRDYDAGDSYIVKKMQVEFDFRELNNDCIDDISEKLKHLPPRPSTATRSNLKGQKRIGFIPRNKMRPEEVEVIREMAKNGCTQSHIAEVVGCSIKTVQVYSR